jgi:ribonuclease Z
MRHLFEPRLVNGPLGEPGLVVDLRDERRALLFDLGDVATLPPRVLMRVSHVFVSHTHMDHFAGFDALLRVVLGRKERVVFTGGPDFVDQVEHKLRAYTWNVVHRYPALTLEVREFGTAGELQQAAFSSRSGFAREDRPSLASAGDVLLDEPLFRVRACFVDHAMPCLAFAIEEKARACVAKDRLAAFGVSTGAWLRELKRAVLARAAPQTPILLQWRDRDGVHATTRTVGELAAAILAVAPGQRIGYVTDLRYTEQNLAALKALLGGVDRLYVESVFSEADREHALRKHHLTAGQAGALARELGAHAVTPFHFSPRYAGREAELQAELLAAWSPAPGPREALSAPAAHAWTRSMS